MTAMASQARRNRWAVSFADLLLLLLGFFILLQASGQKRDGMLAQVRQQFGGRTASSVIEWRAATLFLPDEALLSNQGRAAIARATAGLRSSGGRIDISSQGTDPARRRFDPWDLAAARLGAVARELKAQGLADDRLRIRGLDQMDGDTGKGQVIRVGQRAPSR
ncbi:flagellar motor protein MotB [Sphingobium vermicomposti]|uniref:Flagellar motor protein MotB n=1 Tax=Sphingobium vermicomposti TaxID=529005 RepID=A0A846M432_9SPHN|nr:flagellar motor protein MotB [Sphingobium vermicomposti]NIJ15510.1 flagellar motor protein MotB [Sphingobium vermicomposti]